MNGFFVYWVIGCFIVGSAAGFHDKKCPNDPEFKPLDVLASVAAWPASFGYLVASPIQPVKCKVLP